MVGEIWKKCAADFNAMTDAEIASEVQSSQQTVDRETEWIEAAAAWEAAGMPRSEVVTDK